MTTTNATDLIVGANMVTTFTSGPGASFTSRVITSPDGDILEDRIVTALGTYNASASIRRALGHADGGVQGGERGTRYPGRRLRRRTRG